MTCRRNGHHHGPCSSRCDPTIPPRTGPRAGVRYVVHDENALCYVDPARNDLLMGVLAGDVLKGGPDWKNGPIAKTGRVRPATLEDFERFRVDPKGHL